ncbi:hypothetical protein MesoLjLc_50490 [Mesorhizobium sp. L-8-10]|uniref:DUF2460 domain-containing protein n=1 Tax=Mesorhizobium sp. L-8-10 TaxID=2744523 RepID=UPI00192600C8|nr:DUF2460 domain-containing protein [Mesorhizobium sp. L-8-10]BCH33119.1 hypothetical protein MesoLjLc_50490 [Mesorhizobium sp. L-8-10]
MVDNVILSEQVALGFKGGPTFSTDKLAMVNGQERRLQNRSVAIHQFMWEYRNQTRAIVEELREFWFDRRGDFKAWLLKDWGDYQAAGEPFGVGDGSTKTFPLIKTYTGGFNPYERTIRHPKSGTLQVFEDGIEASSTDSPSAYHFDSDTGVTFAVAPANGVVLTWTGHFYVPVRFDGDVFFATVDYPTSIDALSVSDLRAVEVIP